MGAVGILQPEELAADDVEQVIALEPLVGVEAGEPLRLAIDLAPEIDDALDPGVAPVG